MSRKLFFIFITGVFLLLFVGLESCTENNVVKFFGGTATHHITAGHKLINVTWKDNNLWLMTRKRREGEPVEQYEFKEKSSMGSLEGTFILVEQ